VRHARLTLILLFVLAALAAYVFVYERGEVVEGPVALRFAPDEVTAFEIKDPAGTLSRIARKGKAWRMTKPADARADKEAVTQFLDDLKRLGDEGEIGENLKSLEPYGLDKPRSTLTLVRSKKPSLTLLLGEETPDEANTYAMLKGGSRVFVVRASVGDQIARGGSQFRDKTVLPFAVAQVERVTLVRPGGRVTAERKSKAPWRLTEPLQTDGDAMALEALVLAAHDLKAAEFIADEPADPAFFGLDKPRLEVRLRSKGQRSDRTISFGREAPADRLYVRTSTEPTVYAVAKADFANLDKALGDLRAKEVLAFEHDGVTSVRLTSPLAEVQLVRTGPADERRWEIAKPRKAAADDRTVDDVLYALSGLRAEEFVDKPGPLADYALDKPRLQAELTVSGRKTPIQLLVGKTAADQSGVFVKRADGATVYRVPQTVLGDLAPEPTRFLSRQVLKLNRDDIERIVLEHGRTRLVIERQGKDRWRITSPRKAEAGPAKVAAILFTLEDVRGDALVAEAPSDLAPYGLDKPGLSAEITLKGRREPERLLVGDTTEDGNRVYVKRESATQVYLKDRHLLDDLRKDVDDLKE